LANRFVSTVRSGDIFPGRDPLYDDLVAVLNSVESVAASTNSTSNLKAAGNPETRVSVKQAVPVTEIILVKAQLNRQQVEITSLKERIRGKVVSTLSNYPLPS
jgi:hypothetical protein